jgi:hypothetical protein
MAVPWTQLLRWAPQIIGVSRELLQRSKDLPQDAPKDAPVARTPETAALARRIAALEENERRQAELVERMAEQQAELARALVTLHRRERWLIGALVVLGALVIALLAWQLSRP